MSNVIQGIKNGATSLMLRVYGSPTSYTSKVAKSIVAMVTMMFVTAQPVFAAEFITAALGQLGLVIIAIGGGLGIWGIVNLLEGYGNDNAGAKSQGIKQLMAGGGLILIGIFVPDALDGLFG